MKKFFLLFLLTVAMTYCEVAKADNDQINRYKVDFYYQGIGYQILPDNDQTVAVCQPYDFDFAGLPTQPRKVSYVRHGVGPNGFLMSNGLLGLAVVIPQTVYDDNGRAYTVTNIADNAINNVGIGTLVLPPTLESLNGGIFNVHGLSDLYLPAGLLEINGIWLCSTLKNIHIPWNVKTIKKRSLWKCGFETIFLPPTVKALEDDVLAECDSLTTATISEVEYMGEGCFKDCKSFMWANIPETLHTMGDGCFNGCTAMELVSLPWSEIKMDNCFNSCPSINQIEVLAVEPYPFPDGCFKDVDRSKCKLVVPEGSVEKYKAADGWKEFCSIQGTLPAIAGADVSAIQANGFRAIGGKGSLRIFNSSQAAVEVFRLNGEKMTSVSKAGVSEISLPAGIYIVASPFSSCKVAVN